MLTLFKQFVLGISAWCTIKSFRKGLTEYSYHCLDIREYRNCSVNTKKSALKPTKSKYFICLSLFWQKEMRAYMSHHLKLEVNTLHIYNI